jgi:hypothetical protein
VRAARRDVLGDLQRGSRGGLRATAEAALADTRDDVSETSSPRLIGIGNICCKRPETSVGRPEIGRSKALPGPSLGVLPQALKGARRDPRPAARTPPRVLQKPSRTTATPSRMTSPKALADDPQPLRRDRLTGRRRRPEPLRRDRLRGVIDDPETSAPRPSQRPAQTLPKTLRHDRPRGPHRRPHHPPPRPSRGIPNARFSNPQTPPRRRCARAIASPSARRPHTSQELVRTRATASARARATRCDSRLRPRREAGRPRDCPRRMNAGVPGREPLLERQNRHLLASAVGPARRRARNSDPLCGSAKPDLPPRPVRRGHRSAQAERSNRPSSGAKGPVSGMFER